jgi:hypothetical protein
VPDEPKVLAVMLDDEQQQLLQKLLKRALGTEFSSDKFHTFVRDVESSMVVFSEENKADRLPFRQIHDRLRRLWFLANADDPPIGQIRAEINKLPDTVIGEIERRAPRILSVLCDNDGLRKVSMAGGKTIKIEDIQTIQWTENGGFRAWAQNAKASLLLRAVSVLTGGGGRMVEGRSRGKGKRSQPHFEPEILGVTRGADNEKPKGGRPRVKPAENLTRNLAIDWRSVTGSPPEPGRSDRTGFGELVYLVFSWAAAPDDASQDAASAKAEYSLRDYWERYRKAQALDAERKAKSTTKKDT